MSGTVLLHHAHPSPRCYAHTCQIYINIKEQGKVILRLTEVARYINLYLVLRSYDTIFCKPYRGLYAITSSSRRLFNMQIFKKTSFLLLTPALLGLSHAFEPTVDMHVDDFDAIRGIAEYITSSAGLSSAKGALDHGLVSSDFELETVSPGGFMGHGRRLGATDEECGAFLAASLAPHLWECFDMAQTVLNLVKQENCKTSYDFSQANMHRICTNQCHDVLHKTLSTMSSAGCSASILKQSCNECASGEKCVGTKCRTVCSPSLPCPCSYACESGACIPPKNSEVTVNDMGVNGYKIALEYLCTTSPTNKNYCFADIFGVLNAVDASTFCSKMKPIGCCTGTVFNFVTECVTSNDTLSTSVGSISLTDLQQFCPEIDFKTPCANVPPLEPGACLDTYYLSGAWSMRASVVLTLALASLATVATFVF